MKLKAIPGILATLGLTVISASAAVAPQTCIAACYNRHLSGHRTASGKLYNPHALTAASGHFPLGSHVVVTNLSNQRVVALLVNDKMPNGNRVIMDISKAACTTLHFPRGGTSQVRIEAAH